MGDHCVEAGPEDRGLDRYVDELCFSGREPPVVGDHRADRAFRGRVVPRLRHRDAHRRAITLAVQGHHAPHGGEREIRGEVACVRAVLAERCRRHVDQARVDLAQLREADAARGHRARCGVFEQEGGRCDQALERRAPRGALEVEDDASLAAVESVKAHALQTLRQARHRAAAPGARRCRPAARP